jgi:hypothetical protein
MFALVSSAACVRINAPIVKGNTRNVSARAGFQDSVAGKSNWNAYEGSAEKALTKEEKAAKNKAEDEAAAARRAASAKKMAEEAAKRK